MKNTIQKKKQEGFTIIEVLIVLAIAGLIMLIVFLAVPALQRNSRNTQRNNDAAAIAGAVSECLSNKNGKQTSCDSIADAEVPVSYDKISQLKDEVAGTMANVSFSGAETTAPTAFTPATGTAAITNIVVVRFGEKCTASGDGVTTGTPRQFAIVYQVENQSGNGVTKCVDS